MPPRFYERLCDLSSSGQPWDGPSALTSLDEGYSADKIAFWIGDTPQTVRLVCSHLLEESSAPAAAAIDEALQGFGEPSATTPV